MGSGSSIPQSTIDTELKKPLDASDIPSFDAAQAEVYRLRQLLQKYDRVPEVIVAVDGSDISDRCVDAALRLRTEDAKMVVMTVTDLSKKDLPPEYKPETIVNHFETELVSQLPAAKYGVVAEEKSGRTTCKAVCDFINDQEARRSQLLVIGMHGRKSRGHKPKILGQTSDVSLRQAFCPVCIVRNDGKLPKANEKATFLVAFDGSLRSVAAYDLALMFKKKQDKLICITVVTDGKIPEKSKAIKDIVCIDKKGGTTIAKHIIQYMKEIEDIVTHLFIGSDGMGSFTRGKRIFGSVSDKLVKDADCPAIIVQSMEVD